MKKIIMLLCFTGMVNTAIRAQYKCLKEKDNLLNLQYTCVDYTTMVYKAVMNYYGSDIKVTGFGPIGASYERIITPGFALGAEFSYGQVSGSYDQKVQNSPGYSKSYHYDQTLSTVSAMVRMNFHKVITQHFNFYWIVAVGYRNMHSQFSSDRPGYSVAPQDLPLPIGAKLGLGLRYMNENMGVFSEFSLSSQILNLGLCFKL
ncbi:MAG TPA: hypothetical protein PLQ93_09525 [Bacteroidia bacterium]|nr:hypothetical protein [Bacteroidia bacterium]